jgi:hypothetical protein
VEVVCALLLLAYTVAGPYAAPCVRRAGVPARRAPAMPALAPTPNLVPREAFSNAVALNSSVFHVATIVGPSLVLLYVLGPTRLQRGRRTAVRGRDDDPRADPGRVRHTEPASLDYPRGSALRAPKPVVLGEISLISSRCCSAVRPRSCRPTRATSCTPDRKGSASGTAPAGRRRNRGSARDLPIGRRVGP